MANDTLKLLTGDPLMNEAKANFDRCVEWESTARKKFIEDIKFENADSYNGYQWPDDIRKTRDLSDRPCLTLNITKQHNKMISNEARKNKSSAKILGMGNGATQESANCVKDIIRHIEYISNAQAAYTMARGFQIGGGIGWWRIITDYESNDSFDQEIYIAPIADPLAVYMDPDIIPGSDGSDAKFAFVFDFLPDDQIRSLVPDWSVDGPPKTPLGLASGESFFIEKDHTMVCEWFRKVPKNDRLFSFINEQGVRINIKESMMPDGMGKALAAKADTMIRHIVDWDIEWRLIVGDQFVDERIWPGKYIPLIRCLGEETVIESILDRKGHTRCQQDGQRMYNYNAACGIDTPVPTPKGWVTIGDLEAGNVIFGANGEPVVVKEALPIRYGEECFKITFTNGHSIVTDAGHIWRVEERGKRKSDTFEWKDVTVSTSELIVNKHFIKNTKPLELLHADFSIDPYLLGVWLGDGSSYRAEISAHIDDVEEEKAAIEALGYRTGKVRRNKDSKGCVFTVHGLRKLLKKNKLLQNKHVPISYLRGSIEQRLALLQGLMDTDGHFAQGVNQCIFVNNNSYIVSAVLELCASLGINATVAEQPEYWHSNGYVSNKSYRVQFSADPEISVFRLTRKAEKQTTNRLLHWRRTKRIGIKSIEAIESVPVRCIKLDTPEHLFLVGRGMIPTHNSGQVEFGALQGKTPWLAPAKAIEEHESMWNTANTENHSVLIYNHLDDQVDASIAMVPPPQRIEPPNASPLYESGMNTAFNQLMMVSGQWQNQMGMMGNERTGRAIQERQDQGDTATFDYQDNYAEALRYTYKQIIDLIPKIYDTRRVKHIQADDGTDMEVLLDPSARMIYSQTLDNNNRVIARVLNPQLGKYDVAADVGPATTTRRQETFDALSLILTQAPGLTGIIGDLLLKSMDFDDAQEAALRLKRMVPPQALGQGPTPQEQQLQAQNQQLTSTLAEALQRHGKDALKLVGKDQMRDIDVYKAETDRIKALLPALPTDQQGLQSLIEQLVGEALKTHLLPVIQANMGGLGDQSESDGEASGNGLDSNTPPIEGAQKAPDGQWYILDPTRKTRYLRIGPLAQERRVPNA